VWLIDIATLPAAAGREAVAEIEELGYGALWIGEGEKDAYTHSALLLAASQRIIVATGIANIWVRDARASVSAANTLGEAYPGRFLLGLGVSHPPLVDTRGHRYQKPVAAMTEYLDAMDSVDYAAPLPPEPVPRVLAALRPPMLRLAAERSWGAHPYFTPPEHTRRAREIMGEGPLLAPEQAVFVGTDPDEARRVARSYMGIYLRLLDNYRQSLLWLGFEEADFANDGSDRLVEAIVAWGDVDAICARVREHLDAGADHVCIQPIAAEPGQVPLDQLRELAPALLEL
jgi:probable F420-dependent oxidoreductase